MLYIVPPEHNPWLPSCALRSLTGFYCPGCGLTRALHHLLHGHISAACRMNPGIFLILPVLGYALVTELFPALANNQRTDRRPTASWALLALLMIFWVIRNIPTYPFTLLAPH